MSLDEFNKLLPPVEASDADVAWLSTDRWLTYHGSVQGHSFVSNLSESSFANPISAPVKAEGQSRSQRAKQAHHDYKFLQT